MVFIEDDLDKPLGLSVDYTARRLYWVDDFRDTIESVNLMRGTDRRKINLKTYTPRIVAAPKLFALSIFEVNQRLLDNLW